MIEKPAKQFTKFILAFAVTLAAAQQLPTAVMADDLAVSGEGSSGSGGEGSDEGSDDGLSSSQESDCGTSTENSRC